MSPCTPKLLESKTAVTRERAIDSFVASRKFNCIIYKMPSRTAGKPHVLILGAGLGGLTLAQALRKQGISFEVFEKDKGLHARFQGWAIALQSVNEDLVKSTPDDLPPLSVVSHLHPLKHLQAEFCMYRTANGGERMEVAGTSSVDLLRANRSRLRDWLATNLHVQWDKHVSRIEEGNDGVTIYFSDGTAATGDILVGADGVRSFVRHYLLGDKDRLHTLPLGFITGEPSLDKAQYERQLQLGHSAYLLLDDKKALRLFVGHNSFSEDASTAKYYWSLGWDDPAAEHEPYWTRCASKQQLYDHALGLSKQFDLDPKLTEIVRLTKPDEILTPPIVIRDMVLTELPNRRVTLLGDAAHPMTPFRGEGGNNALRDALNLARSIAKSEPSTILEYLKEYQEEMLERGSKAVKASRAAAEDTSGSGTQAAWRSWENGRRFRD